MRSYSCCTPSTLKSKDVTKLSLILKLVSDVSRLKILCILRQGEHCVCEIMAHLHFSQSLVSHHLKDLKNADIVDFRKEKNKVYYFLTGRGTDWTNLLFKTLAIARRK